jgi:hypothetical protein
LSGQSIAYELILVHTFSVPIERRDISDSAFEDDLFQMLLNQGFAPSRSNDLLQIKGVGVGEGDSSVDLIINLVEMDGHRILELSYTLPSPLLNFNEAVLIAAQGNQSCLTVKFALKENLDLQAHEVRASMVISADNLGEKELATMLYLFIKEVDAIDNKLLQMSDRTRNL